MLEKTFSKNQINIRLTDERWSHIIEEHCELAGMKYEILDTISNPEKIYGGNRGELLALKAVEMGKYIVVVYKESARDGFVITAFLTKRIKSFKKRTQIWPN